MKLSELVLIAFGLAMDAFAVSVSNGMTMPKFRLRNAFKFGIFFGVFQMLMPIIGWATGRLFSFYVIALDHWIAFILLGYIGVKMIREAMQGEEEVTGDTSFCVMLILAIATSIDALAAGITFAFSDLNIWFSVGIIGLITFVLCTFGVIIGKRASASLGNWAQIAGGSLLILMGIKVLVEHLL